MPFTLAAAKLAASAVPWGMVLKGGILAVLFTVGVGVGCSCQSKRDQGKIDKANATTDVARADAGRLKVQGDLLAQQLRDIDTATRAQKAAADARVAAAQAEAKIAAAETEAALKVAHRVVADLEKAKRDPDCKKLLETKSCAAFR